MKKAAIIATLALTLVMPKAKAQYASINVDYSTMAAMSEAYSTEAAMEALHNENLQKIYESYKAAGVASAGIFSSKYLDRKALTSLDLWDDKNENYYYTRIYNIVSKRIIPKTLTCARLMVDDPSTALYWGSYLVKTCNDVKSLCQQFESIVTNSSLTFNDIAFLEVKEELAKVLNLANLGGIDWKGVFEAIGDDIEGSFTLDNLKKDIDNLVNKGVGLANAGFSGGVSQLLQGTSFGGTFEDKLGSILTLMDNASGMYDTYKGLSATQILTSLAGQDKMDNLFSLGDYNLTRWIDDYQSAAKGQYYTQRVYIYRRDSGSETLCDYSPPTDDNSIINGDEWYRISTKDANFTPSSAQYEQALSKSESHAGWSRSKVKELNASDTKYKYNFYSNVLAYILSKKKSGQYAKAYAYHINVTKSWDIKEEVYEDVFDSYSMDWNTFIAQMNARLSQYNANGDHADITNTDELNDYIATHPQESNYTYYIGYDERHYYTATDDRKIAGASTATFTVTCHDGGTLGKGSTTYKCSKCGGSPNSHTKECTMQTTLVATDDAVDVSSLQSKKTQAQQEAATLQAQLDALNAENSELLRQMSKATASEYEEYRKAYETNKAKIDSLQSQLDTVNDEIADISQAINEAEEGEKEQTDDYNRIPQLMKYMQDAYHITWSDAGSWSGYTFVRNGTVGSVKGMVTFKATVSIARKPKYFLGIKIHRAIVQIDWQLTSDWTDSHVAEIMELDPEASDADNADKVNKKMSELAQEYPSCDISVEYTKTETQETEDTDGTRHLLWASDRLDIARGIEARLARIYTDLVMVEKFLHYKHSLSDWAQDLLPRLNSDKDRKMTIAERCRRRWLRNGGSAYYAEYEEDEEGQDDQEDINDNPQDDE